MKRDEVILGVDTHLNGHVGSLISNTGKCLGILLVNLASWPDGQTDAGTIVVLHLLNTSGRP
jgi:hypothetical protein